MGRTAHPSADTQRVRVSQRLPTHGAQVGLAGVCEEVEPELQPLSEGLGTVWAAV